MALKYLYPPKRHERAPSRMYQDNYGYTTNFYQPMIDYLDRKRHGTTTTLQAFHHQQKYPHLPWTYERGLRNYRPSNSVRTYSPDEIIRLSRAAAARAEQSLINARVVIRSPFSVAKTADAARISKHLSTVSVLERAKRRKTEREEELRQIAHREYTKYLQFKRRMADAQEVQISDDLKRAIRGKSATAISAALLAESERNIKTAKKEEEEFIQQALSRSSRAVSESRFSVHSAHIEFVDERLIDNLDYKVSSSLCNVKRQLSNLNAKTSEFYSESRCVPPVRYPHVRSLRSNLSNRLSRQKCSYVPLYKLKY